ncbi:helix-turn-helix domain-containing protein [Corynebacterium sp. LaCa116]|uniref:helix-turn-helix domain-containing protein n=1 Tax=Corynebacterium sp. LaCa116 TaxID=3391423 RepID=UPI00398A4A15
MFLGGVRTPQTTHIPLIHKGPRVVCSSRGGLLPGKDNTMQSTRTYTAQEVAGMLGVALSTLLRHTRAGKLQELHPIQVGNRIVFPRTIVDQLLGDAA